MTEKTPVNVHTPEDTERYATILETVAEAVSRGDLDHARTLIAPIAGLVWVGRTPRHTTSAQQENTPGDITVVRRARRVTDTMRAHVFARDNFRCTMCGGRTIPRNILVVLSDLFPTELPYNKNYRHGETHPAYWFLAPEADHIIAHSVGGTDTTDNLTTLHARCNTSKADLTLDITTTTPLNDDWDGLLRYYPHLIQLATTHGHPHATPTYHPTWLKRYGK